MIIERTNKEIIFRLPANSNVDDLQDMADLFEFRELSKKPKATQKDVDALVKSVKKGRWAKIKIYGFPLISLIFADLNQIICGK